MSDPHTPAARRRLRVADFPRPPAIERDTRRITITLGGVLIADTRAAWRILETTHPPTYYLPPDAFAPGSVRPGSVRASLCEWKGRAHYLTLIGGERREADAAWPMRAPCRPIRRSPAISRSMPGAWIAARSATRR